MQFRITSLCLVVFCLLMPRSAFSDTIELIIYYPTPSALEDINAGSMAVGTNFSDETSVNGVLIVEERIGVGTLDPQVDLDIYSEGEAFIRVMGTGVPSAPENYSGIDFAADTNADGNENTLWQLAHKHGGNATPGTFHLNRFDGVSWRTRLAVLPDGSVGIGLGNGTAPSATLDVGGSFHTQEEVLLRGATVFEGDFLLEGAVTRANLARTLIDGTGVVYQEQGQSADGEKILKPLLHTYHPFEHANLFIGFDAGNFDLGVPDTTRAAEKQAGGFNVGIGTEALDFIDSGAGNVVMGYKAMSHSSNGNSNLAIGNFSLSRLGPGSGNVAVGHWALDYEYGGSFNTAVGALAGASTRGERNAFVGYQAGGRNVGTYKDGINKNVAVGAQALSRTNNAASDNTAVGVRALNRIGQAVRNTAIGFEAGHDIGFGGPGHDNNLFIGYQAGFTWRGANKLFIANGAADEDVLIYGDFADQYVKVRGNLSLGPESLYTNVFDDDATNTLVIGADASPTTSPDDMVQLFVEGVANAAELQVRDEDGNVTTLSPHNFSLIPQGPSEPLAWSYYSEKDGQVINVDMLKAVRLVETLSDEKLVYSNQSAAKGAPKGLSVEALQVWNKRLAEQLDVLEAQNQALESYLEALDADQ